MKEFLTYEEFGAVGNGYTDDFDAIIACHEEANRTGTPVKARDGAKYLLKKIATATIKTDVDFGTAEFIIYDVGVPLDQRRASIFCIVSDYEKVKLDITSFRKDQGKLEFEHEGNVFVRIADANHPQFIRKGLNKNAGKPKTDSFIVDDEGNVRNRVNYDYDNITEAYYKCVDDKPITIKGGCFITIANQAESFYNYHARAFSITRANVTVEGMTHLIYGEGEHGAPYSGFICVTETYNVTVKNCLLTPHFIYRTASKEPGKLVNMGSYDINFGNTLNCTIKGIRQTVDIFDSRYWGLIHTNFSKDLTVEDCIMSRYDAHEGVTNITVRDCAFGHQMVNLIGYGEALLENCKISGPHFIALRDDYGSFWNGNITVRNCTWTPTGWDRQVIHTGNVVMLRGYNTGDHDFGYPCAMPTVLTVDGLDINDENLSEESKVFILPWYDGTYDNGNKPFPYVTVKSAVLKNITAKSGRKYIVAPEAKMYPDLKVTEE